MYRTTIKLSIKKKKATFCECTMRQQRKKENVTKFLINFQIPNLNDTNLQEHIFLDEYTFSWEFRSTITGVWMHIYLLDMYRRHFIIALGLTN